MRMSLTTDWIDEANAYRLVVSIGEDTAVPLIGDAAAAYARAVTTAGMYAGYDAAIVNQWHRGLRHPDRALPAAMLDNDIRPDRPPIDCSAFQPITFEPIAVMTGVDRASRADIHPEHAVGRVRILVDGEPIGSWSAAEAMDHGRNVLAAYQCAELDTQYWRFLHHTIGLPAERCRAVVNDVGLWVVVEDQIPTSLRLARDLREEQCPPELVERAREGAYDEFESDDAIPLVQLAADLRAAGRDDLAGRVVAGEWEASKDEGDAWMEREGAEFLGELWRSVGTTTDRPANPGPRPGQRPAGRDGKPRRRRRK